MTTQAGSLEIERLAVTAGDIAAINLESARQRSWNRFWRAPEQPGIAELIVEQEQLTAQFTGDLAAFDRLEVLVHDLAQAEPDAARTALVSAQVACTVHRFADARKCLSQAVARGAPASATDRLGLTIDQATGTNLSAVLAARHERAARPGHWDERIPLGALLGDLDEFDEADRTYVDALRSYPDASPFAPAWACFQLGALWGEVVPVPVAARAAQWYRKAIDYLPCYVKARVHLSEILLDAGDHDRARALLLPVLDRADPEVTWRLAEVAMAAGDEAQASAHLDAARAGFEALLSKHMLAFADHAAEFYMGSGGDANRALELARVNLANRPTARAFELYVDACDRLGEDPCPTAEHS
jgi:tetratricopeptide (TPR) repeat protein